MRFCGAEVGALKRSSWATKEFICNDCKRKGTNYFARMSYTSGMLLQRMMDTSGAGSCRFWWRPASTAGGSLSPSAERSFNTWDLAASVCITAFATPLSALSDQYERDELIRAYAGILA